MKQVFIFIFLVSFMLTLGCSSKRDIRTSASIKSADEKSDVKKAADKDEITIKTPDGVNLSANYYYGTGNKEVRQPLVILIHQFKQDKEQWAESFIDSLTGAGCKVLAYDIRGHGESDKVSYDLKELLTDPDKAPQDVDGVFKWAMEQKGIDTGRIGVMGTSIGGNLACYARYRWKAKTVIDISGSEEGFEKFIGIDPRMMGRVFVRLTSIYFICGSKDDDKEKDAKYLMDNYVMAPMDLKVYDTDKHGIFLIREYPEIYSLALGWFKKYL